MLVLVQDMERTSGIGDIVIFLILGGRENICLIITHNAIYLCSFLHPCFVL